MKFRSLSPSAVFCQVKERKSKKNCQQIEYKRTEYEEKKMCMESKIRFVIDNRSLQINCMSFFTATLNERFLAPILRAIHS